VSLNLRAFARLALALALQAPASTVFADAPTPDERTAAAQGESDPAHLTLLAEPLPQIEYDFAKLPLAVKNMREQIIEAASSGDMEKLKPIFDKKGGPPRLNCDVDKNAIDCLRSQSGDSGGLEILANLISLLEAGYVHLGAGTPDDMYVWPYFAVYPVDKLAPPQLVELFKLVPAADVAAGKPSGAYPSYRVGIAPDGAWKYFTSNQ
jgi:hypothetical protein